MWLSQLRTRKGGEAWSSFMVEIEGKGKLHTSYGEIKPRASMEWGAEAEGERS